MLSIVLTCYNEKKFFEDAINSALSQTYSPKELIIVNDGNDPKISEILGHYKGRYDKLILLPNVGICNARNEGISKASGKFILIHDGDDTFDKSFCEKGIQKMKSNMDVKIVTSKARLIDEDSNVIGFHDPKGGDLKKFLFENQSFGTALIRKDDWQKIGGFDPSMRNGFEDWEFFLRLLSDGGVAEVIPEVLFNYRIKKESRSVYARDNKFELLKQIFTKHSDLYKEHFADLIVYYTSLLEIEKREKIKNTRRVEFIIGKVLLFPLRRIKKIFMNFMKS